MQSGHLSPDTSPRDLMEAQWHRVPTCLDLFSAPINLFTYYVYGSQDMTSIGQRTLPRRLYRKFSVLKLQCNPVFIVWKTLWSEAAIQILVSHAKACH